MQVDSVLEEAQQAIALAKHRLNMAATDLEIDAVIHELWAAELRFREAYRRVTGRVA